MLRAIARVGIVRHLHQSSIKYGASVFNMPAMSPTMSEGGIVEWKLSQGDSFQAGDVLLEVETDKATIDVEAQDDGKIFEIIKSNGEKGIAVGTPIAILAEPEDDLSTLEKPNLQQQEKTPAPKSDQSKDQLSTAKESNEKTESKTKLESKHSNSSSDSSSSFAGNAGNSSSSGSIFVQANPNQKFSPSVELLLHENNISREDALKTIKASGPKGRILKGDVLAHLGKINSCKIESITKFLISKQHLDLSNIIINQPTTQEAKSSDEPSKPQPPKNVLHLSFQGILGELSPQQFKYATEKSIKSANLLTYKHAFPEYENGPIATPVSNDDIFNELLVAPSSKPRFKISDLKFNFNQNQHQPPKSTDDSFDELLGLSSNVQPKIPQAAPSSVGVSFTIKYDLHQLDSKQFVDNFTQSLLSQIPANDIQISNLE
jgi:hypothetical protein